MLLIKIDKYPICQSIYFFDIVQKNMIGKEWKTISKSVSLISLYLILIINNKMKLILLILIIAPFALSKLYQVVSLTRHGARYHVNDFGDGN